MANIFDWWNLGKDSAANLKSLGGPENSAKFKNLISNDWAQRQIQNVGGSKFWNPVRSLGVWAADKGGMGSGPTPLVRQAARRIGLPAAVGFGAYDLTNAAIDKFGWEDNLKNFGGSIYDFINPEEETNRNLFNPVVPAVTFAKNILGFEGTPETFQQEEWMKNKLLEKVRNSGSLSGTMTYDDYGSKVNPTGGIFGAPFAYSNSLGQSDYSIPQQGGQVDFAKSGTAYNFEPGDLPGKMGEVVTNIVNRGGLLGKGTPQHYTPNITITPREIQNIFGGGQMVHKGEPTITPPTITQPTVQPVTQPTNEPTITPPPARAVIPNQTKFGPTRSTAIRGGRGGRGNVGARKKTQSSAPVFKSYGPPNMQRY